MASFNFENLMTRRKDPLSVASLKYITQMPKLATEKLFQKQGPFKILERKL